MKRNARIGIIVQARMGSTRLPGKVMKKIMGKPLLEHVILRLQLVKSIDQIVIATTDNPKDNPIVDLASKIGIGVFRGSEENVLERYHQAAKMFQLDVIVRITSDCPVIDPELVDKVINYYMENQPADYASNCIERTFPRGLDVEVFSFEVLERAFVEATEPYEIEHVTPYLYQNPSKFKILNFKNAEDYSFHRWTVDTKEDLELINIIYENLYYSKVDFSFGDILKLFENRPELLRINQHVRQKSL